MLPSQHAGPDLGPIEVSLFFFWDGRHGRSSHRRVRLQYFDQAVRGKRHGESTALNPSTKRGYSHCPHCYFRCRSYSAVSLVSCFLGRLCRYELKRRVRRLRRNSFMLLKAWDAVEGDARYDEMFSLRQPRQSRQE